MLLLSYLLVGAPLVLARPTVAPRGGYAAGINLLRTELQRDWYADYNETESKIHPPQDPTAFYSCVGPNVDDFPKQDHWLSYKDLWTINEPVITEANHGNSQYNTLIQEAIEEVSLESKVDARLILAMIIQESTGQLDIECTGGSKTDCGLLQHGGSRRFDPANAKASIKGMIEDGIYGTGPSAGHPSGCPGFLTYFNGKAEELSWLASENYWRGNPFAAAHVYNVGSISGEDLTLTPSGKKNFYAHDLLSRLQGWNGWKGGCSKSTQCSKLGFSDREC